MKPFKARAGFTLSTLAAAALLAGCPQTRIEVPADLIATPVNLQAYDIDLMTEEAEITFTIDLSGIAGTLVTDSFVATIMLDNPSIPPGAVDGNNDPLEPEVPITGLFTVDYGAKTAVMWTPINLAKGWYNLKVTVQDTSQPSGTVWAELVVFSVEWPGPDYNGTEGSQPGFLIASLAGVNDQCFGGLLNFLVNGDGDDNFLVNFLDVPSFDTVDQNPGTYVGVAVPTLLDPDGFINAVSFVSNNALLFIPDGDPTLSADLSKLLGGLVPCVLDFKVVGELWRKNAVVGDPRLILHDISFSDPPDGGRCTLPQPPTGCIAILDFGGFVWPTG